MADKVQSGYLRAKPADQSLGPLVVTGPGGTGTFAVVDRAAPLASETTARVASSATVVTLLAANTARRSYSIFNESTAVLFVKHGAAATNTDYKVQIPAGSVGYYEGPQPPYQGVVTGIWAAANGAAQVCEGI